MSVVTAEAGVVVLTERHGSVAFAEELARTPRYRLVGRVDAVRAAVEAARTHRPAVLVVEVGSSERLGELASGGLAATGARVVVVSALRHEASLLTCLGAGARGFLGRPLEPGSLERAVDTVLAGHTFIDPRCTTWLIELALHGHRRPADDGLTLRQLQVVELVRGGLTNREIAGVLGVSPATVKSHLNDAMRRLGAGDRWAATVLAERRREARP